MRIMMAVLRTNGAPQEGGGLKIIPGRLYIHPAYGLHHLGARVLIKAVNHLL